MTTTAARMTTDWDAYLGTRRTLEVADTTTYSRGDGFTFTHENSVSVTTATNYGRSIMVTMSATGSMHGDPVDDDSLGLACATTHMTAHEARALATMLMRAAAELNAAD